MSEDLTGLGDIDVEELDRKKLEEMRRRNPNNQPEVVLTKWTLAHLTQASQVVRSVVFGKVAQCLTDHYQVGDIVCSLALKNTPEHPGRLIYVTQRLRYECIGEGSEVTIPEHELNSRIPDSDTGIDGSNHQAERGDL